MALGVMCGGPWINNCKRQSENHRSLGPWRSRCAAVGAEESLVAAWLY